MTENFLRFQSYENGDPIQGEDQVAFRLEDISIDPPIKSTVLRFVAPVASWRIDAINGSFSNSIVSSYRNKSRDFIIARYVIQTLQGNTRRLILRYANTNLNYPITPPATVRITAPSGNLSALNNKVYTVIPQNKSNKNKLNLHLRVPQSDLHGIAINGTVPSTTTATSVTEQNKTLILRASIGTNNRFNPVSRSGLIQDILIFAYTREADLPNVTAQKYLIRNPPAVEIDERDPPPYADVSSMITKTQAEAEFDNENLPVVDVYVSIARYKNINGWQGQWLQKNENGRAVWKKLIRRSPTGR